MNTKSHPGHTTSTRIPVRVSRSWIAVAVLLFVVSVITLSSFETRNPSFTWYIAAVAVGASGLASILIHDLAHFLAARAIGRRVLALTPSLFGALPDVAYPPHNPRSEAVVPLAGPTASLLLAVIFGAGWYVLETQNLVADVLAALTLFNLSIAVANLMPGFPLDGGRIFRAFVWYLTDDLVTGTRLAFAYGQAITIVTTIAALFLVAIGGSASVWGAWILLGSWTIGRSGQDSYARVLWREHTESLAIEDLGLSTGRRIDGTRTIDDALDELLEVGRNEPLLVTDDSEAVGIATLEEIRRVPRASWSQVPLRSVAVPFDAYPRLPNDAALHDLLAIFDADPDTLVLVETQGRITSVLSRPATVFRIQSRVRSDRPSRKRHKRG